MEVFGSRPRGERIATPAGVRWWVDEGCWVEVEDPSTAGDRSHPAEDPTGTHPDPAIPALAPELVAELARRRMVTATTEPLRRVTVLVIGIGSLAAEVATALRRVGVGTVTMAPRPVPAPGPSPDLVVLAGAGPEPDRLVAAQLVAADLPHLVVAAHGDSGRVGPLVLPGRSPCLQCHDLGLARRDVGWPQVLGSLTGRTARPDPAVQAMVASRTALEVGWLARGLEQAQHLCGRSWFYDRQVPGIREVSFRAEPTCPCAVAA